MIHSLMMPNGWKFGIFWKETSISLGSASTANYPSVVTSEKSQQGLINALASSGEQPTYLTSIAVLASTTPSSDLSWRMLHLYGWVLVALPWASLMQSSTAPWTWQAPTAACPDLSCASCCRPLLPLQATLPTATPDLAENAPPPPQTATVSCTAHHASAISQIRLSSTRPPARQSTADRSSQQPLSFVSFCCATNLEQPSCVHPLKRPRS